jgi:acyl-CoA thioester hydrolase
MLAGLGDTCFLAKNEATLWNNRMGKLPEVYIVRVPSEWIDYNGHMGDFAYNIAFSRAADGLYELFGLDPKYREETHCTIYTLETRTGFYRECKLGDELSVDCQILDVDEKRVHMFLRMYRAGTEELVAVQEALIMHMRREPGSAPAGAAMPQAMFNGLAALKSEHGQLPRPAEVERRMGIRHKTAARVTSG